MPRTIYRSAGWWSPPDWPLPEVGSFVWYAKTMEMVGASGMTRFVGEDFCGDVWLRGVVVRHEDDNTPPLAFVVRMQDFKERMFSIDTEDYCWRRFTVLDLLADV